MCFYSFWKMLTHFLLLLMLLYFLVLLNGSTTFDITHRWVTMAVGYHNGILAI